MPPSGELWWFAPPQLAEGLLLFVHSSGGRESQLPPQSKTTTARDRLGLICGGGRFPFMIAEGARRAGRHVIGLGIKGFADPGLAQVTDEFYWIGVLKVGQWIRVLRRRACTQVIMAGAVHKTDAYSEPKLLQFRPDWTTLGLWFKVPDYRSDTLLKTLANHLTERGIFVEDCIKYTQEALAQVGCLTSLKPNALQESDIEFGWQVAKELGRFDVGQAVAVKEQNVIALEAVEGTDRMIERASRWCSSGGWSLVKVSKPSQDMRFDVPTVGPTTIEMLRRHSAAALCIEAGKTLIVDPQATIALADKYGIVIVARHN